MDGGRSVKNGAVEDLREIPAIIGGDQSKRHGIVLAKSMSAKKYKIQTGEPVAHALRKCHRLLVVPPDHGMYQAYSQRLMDFLEPTFGKDGIRFSETQSDSHVVPGRDPGKDLGKGALQKGCNTRWI